MYARRLKSHRAGLPSYMVGLFDVLDSVAWSIIWFMDVSSHGASTVVRVLIMMTGREDLGLEENLHAVTRPDEHCGRDA